MRVAIHQPNYVPWPGYFYKIACADVFVFLDDAQFTKNGFVNRNRIKGADGARWLTVPAAPALGTPINRTRPAGASWADRHLKTLQACYGKAPCFPTYRDALAAMLAGPYESLAALNIALVERVCAWLGITTRLMTSSTLAVDGVSDTRLARIVKAVGGTEYLSGAGGANYQHEQTFADEGIALVMSDFQPPSYPQLHGEFVAGLSILDMLFNCGEDASRILRRSRRALGAACIEPLSRAACMRHMAELLNVHVGASVWREDHFLVELPDKWSLSLYALADGEAVAYCVLSRKFEGRVHVHQIMTRADRRGCGIGAALLDAARRKLTPGERLSLKVVKDNAGAIRFYERNGFRFEKAEGEYLWMSTRPDPGAPAC